MNNQFDDIIKLLKRKNLIVIGGSPAIGKTTFAINLANNVCNNGYYVAYYSLELSNENICKISKVPIKNIITEMIENGEVVDSNNFNTNQLYVCDKPDLTITDIANKCRELKDKTGLDMVFIDYLQLLLCDKNDLMTRKEGIDYHLRTMKDMAKELDITVVVMFQLQREVEISNDSQLLESSNFNSAEQYADVMLLMNRNRIINNDNEIIDFIVTKNENCETGVVSLKFNKSTLCYNELC